MLFLSDMRYFLILITLLLFGCMQEDTPSAEMLAEKNISESCNIWVEIGNGRKSFVRAGYAGACKHLDVDEYAKYLGGIFSELKLNETNYPQVRVVYVNSYRTDGALNSDLVALVDSSSDWSLHIDSCNGRNLDKEFKKFNETTGYLNRIEKVIKGNFPDIKTAEFNGILPYPGNNKNVCYPDSFGVVTYRIK